MTQLERELLLEALVMVWERETNTNPLSDRVALERCIAWQTLALTGAYDRHAQAMAKLRTA